MLSEVYHLDLFSILSNFKHPNESTSLGLISFKLLISLSS